MNLRVIIAHDWDYTTITIDRNWSRDARQELYRLLEAAEVSRLKPANTYFTRQEWRGSASRIGPVFGAIQASTHHKHDRRNLSQVEIVLIARDDDECTIDNLREYIDLT